MPSQPHHGNQRVVGPAVQKESTDDIELRPDGDARLRAAVRAAARSGPKHRQSKEPKR